MLMMVKCIKYVMPLGVNKINYAQIDTDIIWHIKETYFSTLLIEVKLIYQLIISLN